MPKKLESTANLIVLDLIAEGEIGGLCDQNGNLVSGRNRPGRQGYVDSKGFLKGAYDNPTGEILDESNSASNPFRYKGIYLNDTPVITTPKGPGALGREQVNFRRFYSELRFGHQEQQPLNLLGSQNTISKGERLIGPLASSFINVEQLSESSSSVYHTVTNINVTELIVTVNVTQLFKVESVHEETLGDMKDSEIEFFIEYGIEGEPLRSFRGDHVPSEYTLEKAPIKIKGIATSPYFVDFVIRLGDLNYASGLGTGKIIKGLSNPYKKNRVIKLTRATREKDPEEQATKSDDAADHTRDINWESVVEVVPENFNYGNSVIAASQFDARYFNRIPERAFDCKLMKIPIPSNYDPESRRYKGHWDGTFSTEKYQWQNGQIGKYWTDNPAWIFNDLMTNRRYGVGKFLDPDFNPSTQIDKWNLYEISKICDEIVLTGTSPRNGWLEFDTFTNKLKTGSDNYIDLVFKEGGESRSLEEKFGNTNASASPNLLDYVGQEIVIKTCDDNFYKRKIVSTSYQKTPAKGPTTSTSLIATGARTGDNTSSTKPITIGGSGGGMLVDTGCNRDGTFAAIGSTERNWLCWNVLSHGESLKTKSFEQAHFFSGSGRAPNTTTRAGRGPAGQIRDMKGGNFNHMVIEDGNLKYNNTTWGNARRVTTSEYIGGPAWAQRTTPLPAHNGNGATVLDGASWSTTTSSKAVLAGRRWVGPDTGTVGSGAGVWIYRLEFFMDGYDALTLDASMLITADNRAFVSTNGKNVKTINFSGADWTGTTKYVIRPQDLKPGHNAINFAMENEDNGSTLGNKAGFYVTFRGADGTGDPSVKVSATGSYKTQLSSGESDFNWKVSAIWPSSGVELPLYHHPEIYRFHTDSPSTGIGMTSPFMAPAVITAGGVTLSSWPAATYKFSQTVNCPGDPKETTFKFKIKSRNLRAGDSVRVYANSTSLFTAVLNGASSTSWSAKSYTASSLGMKKGSNNLFFEIILGSAMTSTTTILATGKVNSVIPCISVTDMSLSHQAVLGWSQTSTVTINGGILENEMEGAKVCGEGAVKFSGDYEVAEPRFSCNLLITDKTEAINLLNELASVFRGMLYFANGMTFLTTDVKREPVTLFTNSNTEEGNFSYSGSAKTSRKSVVLVRYNDKEDAFRPKIEYVEDANAINKFGYLEDEVIAYGCTSRGQARRLGEWVLLTTQLEREAINFTAGLEASFLKPGDIFKVIDKNRTIKRFGGRIKDVETDGITTNHGVAQITLDSKIQDKLSHKKLTVITPKKNENVRTLDALAASRAGTMNDGITMEEIANSHEAQITTFEFDPTSDRAEILEIHQDKVMLNPKAEVTRMSMGESQHGRFPDWINSIDYLKGALVKYKGFYWECEKDHKSSIPAGGTYWKRYKSVNIHMVLLEIPVGSIWILECEDEDISAQSHLYRTLKVSESGIGAFEVNGLEYVPNKFDVIEKGKPLEKVKPLPAYSYYGSLPNASLGIEINTG
jgi:hypothetical protein